MREEPHNRGGDRSSPDSMIFGSPPRMRDDSTLTAEPIVAPVQAQAPESPASSKWTARRAAVLVIAYFAALATLVLTRGVHISSDRYFLILLVPAIALGLTRQYLRDWVPFIALMIAYEFARGGAEWLNADILGRGPFYAPMIDVDRALFFGHMPPEFVQSWFWSGHVRCLRLDHRLVQQGALLRAADPAVPDLARPPRALRPLRHGDRDHLVHRRRDLLPVPRRAALAGRAARADRRRVRSTRCRMRPTGCRKALPSSRPRSPATPSPPCPRCTPPMPCSR